MTFAVDGKAAEVLPTTERSVGVDLGVQDFAVLSNGERIGNPHHMARHERGLRRHQKRLARLQKGSKNHAKQREKLARKHSRIRDARRDFLHKTSTGLVKRYDTIAVEDPNVSGMIRNQRLAKSISESGWAEFRSMIAYKAERAGRQLVVIDRWYPSSKTCSACKHVLTTLPLGTRHWTRPSCGTWHDRDHNAAKNILVAAGLAETRNAYGGDVRPQGFSLGQSPVKQELHDVSHGIPVLRGGE